MMQVRGLLMRKNFRFLLLALALNFISADFEAGSGIFGKWVRDRYGLVAYQYEMDQNKDPGAVWLTGKKSLTLHWHQLGNLRTNAIATNDGYVQLFSNESAQRWINFHDPQKLKFSGGFGLVIDGGAAFTSFYPFRPEGANEKRVFGSGYFEKEIEHGQINLNETVFMPAGDLSAMVMRVSLKNLSQQKKKLTYIAYFDVNIKDLAPFSLPSFSGATKKDDFRVEVIPDRSLVVARSQKIWGPDGGYPQKPMTSDPELPDIFLAALDLPAKGAWVRPVDLFTINGWKSVETFKNISWPENAKDYLPPEKICLALAVEVELEPGAQKIFNFAYGYAKAEKVDDLLKKLSKPDELFDQTINYFKQNQPKLELNQDQDLSRELEWDNYYLVSSFLYNAYYQRHFAPQAGNYLYYSGGNGAMRDFAAYIQALSYYHPELAREMLELCLRNQDISGRMFYDFEGYGKRFTVPYNPSDTSLWLLWAACEYIFATRDFAFLKTELPFYPKEKGEKAAVLEHLRRAYDYLEKDVGTGKNGLIKLQLSDWNDEMTYIATSFDPLDLILTYNGGESHLNTTMACHILPMFSALLQSAGEPGKAKEVVKFRAGLESAIQKQWLKSGWFPRAYSALGRKVGIKDIYLEPQVWALLSSGVLSPEQRKQLVDNINTKLRKPSDAGMLISSSTGGSATTKPGEQEKGGIWFAINGPGALALAQYDPVMGYDELKRNTLSWHAQKYPELWYGIWSGPDAFNSVFSKRPGQTWFVNFPLEIGPQFWPVQNNHAHAQFMWALARIAGLEPTAEGYMIRPLLPADAYKLETAMVGIEKSPDKLAGFFKFDSSEWMILKVKLPEGLGKNPVLKIDGKESAFQEDDGFVKFPLSFSAGKKVNWELSKAGK